MSFETLMVHLEIGVSNTSLLRFVRDLATRFDAGVIGVAACQPLQIVYGDGAYVSADFIDQDRAQIAEDLKAGEAEFRDALSTRVREVAWRSTITSGPLSEYVAHEARGADLVVSGVTSGSWLNEPRHVNTGDLVMRVGRPVLVVPAATLPLDLDRVVVAWKDTREARRAVADALPLLKRATHVAVAEIAADADLDDARRRLEDVIAWLRHHGIAATSHTIPSTGNDPATLQHLAGEQRAGLIVAGAYGHSRLREWALGGVTHDLLFRTERCSLVSH